MKDGTNCSNPINFNRYIEEFSCKGDPGNRILKEMHLSFPSGHSSFSAYTMIYCAVSESTPWSTEDGFLSRFADRDSVHRFICSLE